MNETLDYDSIWRSINAVFAISSSEESLPRQNDLNQIVSFAEKTGISNEIQELIFTEIERKLRHEVAPQFWWFFDNRDGKDFQLFHNAVKHLHDHFKCLEKVIERLEVFRCSVNLDKIIYNEKSLKNALILVLKSTLLSQLTLGYQNVVTGFYDSALKLHDVEKGSEDQVCLICSKNGYCFNCLYLFQETNRKLGEMQLLEPLVGQALTNFIYTYIQGHIQKICKDSFDSSFISTLEQWLQSVVLKWLREIYQFNTAVPLEESMDILEKKLLNFLYSSYTKTRINQLFNIIIEYPESLPALEDLRSCLPKTDLKPLLTKKLQKAMETRLLHPGVSTPDVLTAYVAAIRSLKILDPTGLLLETVTQPVHQYLRSREDTVRCVVSSLTEEGPNDLAEELVRGEAVQVDENTPAEDDGDNWETWTPDPIDAVPSKPSIVRRTSDIISMLVNVYGSKELFVNEYRTLLADRLLTQYCCDTEKEIRYLELLKLRFGDSQLHYCEVMLKDVADSKRINQHVKQDPEYEEGDIPSSAMIVSAQFWPPFKEEKLELHPKFMEQRERYTKAFETLKGSRTLCWKNHLGLVDIEIELADRTLSLSVTPVQATIMMHFQDKNKWELEELAHVMQCPATVLRRKIGFWQSHCILIETSPDVFAVQEDLECKNAAVADDVFIDDYEAESAMASAQDQREEELQTFWSYIVGMLMNLDTLPLERIHQMLKMFAFQGPTIECNVQELKVFLDRKVREHQLIYSNGYYKLPK